ncbi:alpha/beta hydrolase [Microbacterium marinilacus]|nr:alpha/beta hydrolase [Microbacterium marinilacus]
MHVGRFGAPGGRTLLLLHGGGVGGWMWEPLRRHLDPGLRLIVPDLPGHDRSAGLPYVSHERTAAALAAIVERKAAGPVAVVGFSLGAQLTVALAASRPDLVERAAVISAQAIPTRGAGATSALLAAAAPLARKRWFARLQARQLFVPDELLDDYLRASARISRRTLVSAVGDNIRFTVPSGWRAFSGPALILAGERERAVMIRSARLLHVELDGSELDGRELDGRELEIVPGCGHGIPLQRPGWLARRLEGWLDTAR